MLEDRRLAVLRAIVEDYVTTHEPVGSKALVERHSLGVSPATIRNDMAALEDEGYIAQPHTSAGRIPTDLGYRHFVDRLSGIKPLAPGERRAIERFLAGSVDLDDVMVRTVRLLAQVTRQVALVQYPSLTRSSVRHVELIAISTTRLLLILVADSGRLEQRTIDISQPLPEQQLADMRARLIVDVVGQSFSSLPAVLESFVEHIDAQSRPAAVAVVATLLDAATEDVDERIVIGGTAHLARYGEEFPIAIQPVLEALEEQVVLMRLMGESTMGGVTVRIGQETEVEGLSSTSVVTTRYGRHGQELASLGIVGPTHMDYANTISSVQAVAQYVTRILEEQ
ncbi:MAG: heat-inducible transcriptional repressor HrcA [Candidatus Nanopelagicales bacterium]|nr:heat-inducible transcriptional repressor HrcA [Candidatus Nanopelagicales bacterium]